MAPWIHMHSWANGSVYPCCVSNSSSEHTYGNLNNSSLKELYNSEKTKQLRRNMLNNIPTDTCQKCYDQEAIGLRSMRQNLNHDYAEQHKDLVYLTDETGYLDPNRMRLSYWDIRFSNICNLKCRTCSLDFSSRWYDDEKKLQGEHMNRPRILNIREGSNSFFEELEPQIPYIQKIYFAGGEPLITQEHWTFVNRLMEQGRSDVELFYQTNLAQLTYKNNNAVDVWNYFDTVNVIASLDASHALAEYMRSGTVWKEIEENIRTVKQQCPHIRFKVSCTVSVLNAHAVVDFYNYLVVNNLVAPSMFEINPVYYPPWYEVKILPQELLDKYKNKIDRFLPNLENVKFTRSHFQSLRDLLDTESRYGSEDWHKFVDLTKKLDSIRNESLSSVHKELSDYIE